MSEQSPLLSKTGAQQQQQQQQQQKNQQQEQQEQARLLDEVKDQPEIDIDFSASRVEDLPSPTTENKNKQPSIWKQLFDDLYPPFLLFAARPLFLFFFPNLPKRKKKLVSWPAECLPGGRVFFFAAPGFCATHTRTVLDTLFFDCQKNLFTKRAKKKQPFPHNARISHASDTVQGHPFCVSHCNTCTFCPLCANTRVSPSQGHPFSLAHCRTSRWPPRAAHAQGNSFQGHPSSLAQRRTSK